MSSDTDESFNVDELTSEICQSRVEEFVKITDTDEALAQFFLQDNKWNLERSVNTYFEGIGGGGMDGGQTPSNNSTSKREASIIEITSDDENVASGTSNAPNPKRLCVRGEPVPEVSTEAPTEFSFVSWNIDGLDKANLTRRIDAVADIIDKLKPDIVFLQEVIAESLSAFRSKFQNYNIQADADGDYFVVTMLRKMRVYLDKCVNHRFETTRMGRGILNVQAHIGPLKLNLFNTHLESCKENAGERKKQFRQLLDMAKKVPADETVIFGGDLNIRDAEIVEVGGLPNDIKDIWVSCGRRKECEFTWDCKRNTNKMMDAKFAPRCRFDRVYLRSPNVQANHFGFIGLEKVPMTQSYPSDHWGLLILLKRNVK